MRQELNLGVSFVSLIFLSGFLAYFTLSIIHVSIHTACGNNDNGKGEHLRESTVVYRRNKPSITVNKCRKEVDGKNF